MKFSENLNLKNIFYTINEGVFLYNEDNENGDKHDEENDDEENTV